MKKYEVLLTDPAKAALKDISHFIKTVKKSPYGAKLVRNKLIERVEELQVNPGRFSVDERLLGRKYKYRSFRQWSYLVIYRVLKDQVLVVDFVHMSRDEVAYSGIE